MRNRFFTGFFEGLALMFAILIFAITCAPVILALMCSNALWLLLYFIIVPMDCGLWNVFF